MTYTVPPAAKPPAAQDVSHRPAPAAPSGPPVPSAPPRGVNDNPAVAVPAASSDPADPGPVSSSTPLPLPEPTEVQYSPVTASAPAVAQKIMLGSGIQPETVVGSQEKTAAPARKAPAAVPSPMAPPVAQAEIYEVGQIAGGVAAPPMVGLAPGSPTVHRDTVYSISDTVRTYAEKNSVDLSTVTPTGKGGRIVKKDVDSAIAAAALSAGAGEPTGDDDWATDDSGDFTIGGDEGQEDGLSDIGDSAPDADILPFSRGAAPVTPTVTPAVEARSLADEDEDEDEDEDGAVPVPAEADVTEAARAADAAAEFEEVTEQSDLLVADDEAVEPVAPVPAAEAAAPPAEIPSEETATAAVAPAATSESVTLRIPVTLERGPVIIPSPQELLAKAQALLPGLAVRTAHVEISTSAPVLVVGAAPTLTLEVTL